MHFNKLKIVVVDEYELYSRNSFKLVSFFANLFWLDLGFGLVRKNISCSNEIKKY